MDALEPSWGMLEKARKKGVYDKHICDCFAAGTCADIADGVSRDLKSSASGFSTHLSCRKTALEPIGSG